MVVSVFLTVQPLFVNALRVTEDQSVKFVSIYSVNLALARFLYGKKKFPGPQNLLLIAEREHCSWCKGLTLHVERLLKIEQDTYRIQ